MNKKIPAKLYREILRNMPIVCIDLVLRDGRKILLVKRKNNPEKGKWWFPGGRLLKNEKFREAVPRLLKKETGLSSRGMEFLGVHEYVAAKGYFPGVREHEIVFVYLVDVPRIEKIALDAQSSDWKWFVKGDSKFHRHITKFVKIARTHPGF